MSGLGNACRSKDNFRGISPYERGREVEEMRVQLKRKKGEI
jgi:hypothetical protein